MPVRRPAHGHFCSSRPRRAVRSTKASGSRSRPGTRCSRRRDSTARAADPRVRPFEPADLPAIARARSGGDGRGPRAPPSRVRDAGRRRASSMRDDGSLGGFVVRAPWGGGATIAPGPRRRGGPPPRPPRRRRALTGWSGPGCWTRTRPVSSDCCRAAGPRAGARLAWSGATHWRGSRGDLGAVQPRPRLSGASVDGPSGLGRTAPKG